MKQILRKRGLAEFGLVAIVFLLYGQFLWNPILFDDRPFFMPDENGLMPMASYHFSLFEVRSLPYGTIAWTQKWFGQDLINFRLGNLVLHAGVVLTLFFFLQALFLTTMVTQNNHVSGKGLSPRQAAFFAAVLFALHPVATFAVGYLVQRTIVMATLFSLLSMLVYVKGSLHGNSIILWMTVPLYFLAVFSKEHAILMPSVLMALTVLLHTDWPSILKQRYKIFLAQTAIAVFVILAKRGMLGEIYEIDAPSLLLNGVAFAHPLSALTQTWLFFKYAGLWLLPNSAWMSIDMREPFATSIFSIYLMSTACFIAWGAFAVQLLLKRGLPGLAGFGMLFPWLLFFTEFSTVRIQEIFVLYRSYLWAAGAFCLVPVLFSRVKRGLATLVLTLIALAMVAISMERLMVMSQPLFVWGDAEKLVKDRTNLPGVYRIYYNRGVEYVTLGMADRAIADLEKAIELNRKFGPSYGALGVAYLDKDNAPKAIEMFRTGIVVDEQSGKSPDQTHLGESHGNLGLAYLKNQDWAVAAEEFSKAIDMARSTGRRVAVRDIYGRGQAYEKIGDLHKAQIDFKESCRIAKKGCEKAS